MVHLALLLIHSRLGMLKIWIHITESLLHLLLLKRRIVIYYQIILDIKSWKADPSKTWSQANETKEAYFISNMTSRVMKMIKKLKKPRKCFHFFENCIKTVSEAFKLIRFFSSQVWNGKKKKDWNNFGSKWQQSNLRFVKILKLYSRSLQEKPSVFLQLN